MIGIVGDDTDVFLMLIKFRYDDNLPEKMYMISAKSDRLIIDIDATVIANSDILPCLLEPYVLSSCDSVCACYGIGKGMIVSTLRNGELY